jgi:hypothetical protein
MRNNSIAEQKHEAQDQYPHEFKLQQEQKKEGKKESVKIHHAPTLARTCFNSPLNSNLPSMVHQLVNGKHQSLRIPMRDGELREYRRPALQNHWRSTDTIRDTLGS